MKPSLTSEPTRLLLSGLAGGLAALAAWAALIEPRRLEIRRSTIHLQGLPDDLEGFRIALLSDLHAGRLTPAATIRKAIRATLREQPHLIALAGDLVDRRPEDLARALEPAADLWAPCGVYAVPGNHDRAHLHASHWRAALSAYPNLEDLTNRHVLLGVGEATLCVAGTDDLEEGTPHLDLPPRGRRDLTILLAHNPEQGERTRRVDDDVDLVLSGHTHGGQIRLPSVGAVHRKSEIYDQGLRRRPWTQVYTSRGVGATFLPLRLGARPELAILELTGAPRPRW